MAIPFIKECEEKSLIKKICLQCDLTLIKNLLQNKYIKVGSRTSKQFAILTGCGCVNGSNVGFVKLTSIHTNPPDLHLKCK